MFDNIFCWGTKQGYGTHWTCADSDTWLYEGYFTWSENYVAEITMTYMEE